MASTYLNKTFSSAGNRKTWTWSSWIKNSDVSGSNEQQILTFNRPNTPYGQLRLNSNGVIAIYEFTGTAYNINLSSTAQFRDCNGWYHIVVSCDTTQATESDRLKIYVNGSEVSLSGTYPSQNLDTLINNNIAHDIGRYDSSNYFDGMMTHIHFIDGTAYTPSAFGETDSTTGIWKPKTAPSVTYGSNGFFLKFENSGSMGTDSSGNGNNFTVNGTMTQTIDTPSNVFATYNALLDFNQGTKSNGNLSITQGSTGYSSGLPTLIPSTGKYYVECKFTDSPSVMRVGIISQEEVETRVTNFDNLGNTPDSIALNTDGALLENGSETASWGTAITNNDIIGVGLDLDNNKLYISHNGTWQNSADPSAGTGGVNVNSGKAYYIAHQVNNGTANANYGNGYFGTTAVASAQNPDDGIGIFEYDVPTGYRALCTKSINAEEYS